MLRSLNLEDFMLPHPVKVQASANIMEAVDLILHHKISGVCVVDDADASTVSAARVESFTWIEDIILLFFALSGAKAVV